MNLSISPSQLAFVYESCPRCLWLYFRKVAAKRDIERFEQFNFLDEAQKDALAKGTPLHALGIPGVVHSFEDWVVSRSYERGPHSFQIRGKYDLLAALDDGGFGVVDLKSSRPNPKLVVRYQKQLSAYALALTEPERYAPVDVRAAYLCHWWPRRERSVFVPDEEPPTMLTYLQGQGIEVPIDVEDLREAMETVVSIATEPYVPGPAEDCPTCGHFRAYADVVRTSREARREREAQGVAA